MNAVAAPTEATRLLGRGSYLTYLLIARLKHRSEIHKQSRQIFSFLHFYTEHGKSSEPTVYGTNNASFSVGACVRWTATDLASVAELRGHAIKGDVNT